MKSRGIWTTGIAALLAAATSAFAAGDVGLINQLNGDVSYSSGASTARVQAFMKVREGDRFSVPSGAQVRIVYFQGGRQESFSGPASFTAGAQQSTVQSGAQPQVTVLPSGVPQKISQTPELIQIAKLGRSGGVAVRGVGREQRLTPQQQAEVRQARETYQQLRASAAADDITPELYLYSVLQDHLLYGDMKPVVEEMARRQPNNPDVAELVAYVKAKTEIR
jgi:hypothetical protein